MSELGSRWERREARRQSSRSRISKHGSSLKRVYVDVLPKQQKVHG